MKTLLAHVRKELRDQRTLLLGVLGALPVLTLLAFWGFGSRLSDAPMDDALRVAIPTALVLYLLAIAGDIFASEIRRGTHVLLLRTPHALVASFFAKLVAVGFGLALTVLWQTLWMWIAWSLWGRYDVPALHAVVGAAFSEPSVWLVVAGGAWMLLASTWLRHGGLALFVVPLTLGVLLIPAVLWGRENANLLELILLSRPSVLITAILLLTVAPLVVAFVGQWRGRRFMRSAFAAVWRSAALLVVLFGAGYAVAGYEVAEITTFEPGDPEIVASRAYAGRDGRLCYLEVYREGRDRQVTPPSTWVVDLETGDARTLGGWGTWLETPTPLGMHRYGSSTVEATSWLVQRYAVSEGKIHKRWIDTRTGKVVKTTAAGAWTADVRTMEDQVALETTWLRDAEGRRVWRRYFDGAMRREGDDGGPPIGPRVEGHAHLHMMTGWGWYRQLPASRGRRTEDRVDAVSGRERTLPPATGFCRMRPTFDTSLQGRPKIGYGLADLAAGTVRTLDSSEDMLFVEISADDREILVVQQVDASCRVALWNPLDEEIRGLDWSGREPAGVSSLFGMGRTADGRRLVALHRQGEPALLALVDPLRATATRYAWNESGSPFSRVVALMPDESLLVLERPHRIVRIRPDSDRREVLFPR